MTLEEFVDFLVNINQTAASKSMLVSLCLALVLGCVVTIVYKINQKTVRKSVLTTLILIPVVTAIVIMTISINIILTIGLVGSLSIIRYRSAVKDANDMSYVFWSLAAGVASGAGEYFVAIVGSLILCVSSITFSKIRGGKESLLVVLTTKDSVKNVAELAYKYIGKRYCKQRLYDRSLDGQKCILEVLVRRGKLAIALDSLENEGIEKVEIYERNL